LQFSTRFVLNNGQCLLFEPAALNALRARAAVHSMISVGATGMARLTL